MNRHYVSPELNALLLKVDEQLDGTSIKIKQLDACFPFIDKFPLLPHLSHNDGNEIDLSLVYENVEGAIVDCHKSRSGYGVFVEPTDLETHQTVFCKKNGYF